MAVWPALRFNKILIGFDEPQPVSAGSSRDGPGGAAAARASCSLRQIRPVTEKAKRPWTDDRAPVEWVTDRMIVEYAARGGELDEDSLPTAP